MSKTTATKSTKTEDGTIEVPFNKLIQDPENARKTRTNDGIDALADNILAEGLLQNLVVRKATGGKFAVTGGERRRRALAVLVKRKKIKPTHKVTCKLITSQHTSASLSENIHRLAMHPADQFEAWSKMHDQGLSVSEIATRHGATPKLVEQRLKLGRLSPVLLDAFREGQFDLQAACAFTITDDHQRQETVYESLKTHWHGLHQDHIRSALTENEIPSSSKIAKIVGRDAYEAAGGEIRTDLFEDVVYYKDADLLTSLATSAMEAEANRLKVDGWKWIEYAFDADYTAGQRMRQIHPVEIDLSDEDQAKLDQLNKRYDEIVEAANGGDDELYQECEDIETQRDELEAKAHAFTDEQKASAGGFLSLDHHGEFAVRLGFIQPEDDEQMAAAKKKAKEEKSAKKPDLSQSLSNDLSVIRLIAFKLELLKNPTIARDLLAFHTIKNVLAPYGTLDNSPFYLTTGKVVGNPSKEHGFMGDFDAPDLLESRVSKLPLACFEIEDDVEAFEAYRALTDDEKTSLQAYAASMMVRYQNNTFDHTAQLVNMDVRTYWTPNADFFARTTKRYMQTMAGEIIDQAFVQRHAKSKKGDLANAIGDAVDPKTETPFITPEAQARLAEWCPECIRND
ncbi:ParB/RepB/Spo0J family partition protein [Cerasicoccus frondis]|uniref:ParB/RepB/Spo0J family partition protein n=1 Tax=Cerasicoccus frondis TaxID=490090 RepID=UPI0028525899|nr:ParB N-terminal domain-containing protein [Cerasicoccus frondis]